MSKPETASASLAALASQSKASRFRALLPDIRAAIERGASHQQIRAALAASSLHMSPTEFRNALYRERHRKTKKGQHAQQPQASTTPKTSGNGLRFDYSQYRDTEPEW
ncbi:hypothetical protein LQD23_21440 [Chromobacterium violaceum]|uniref:hypothetical protein n=1 Tax=Chromobacterium violaceum TaxID=536 RepID=UPI001E497E4B|nr:hypothetical protein [Chromobacterium violaceum]MCD0494843.1 hypothetical protein [Chromobacterium violaceum]